MKLGRMSGRAGIVSMLHRPDCWAFLSRITPFHRTVAVSTFAHGTEVAAGVYLSSTVEVQTLSVLALFNEK